LKVLKTFIDFDQILNMAAANSKCELANGLRQDLVGGVVPPPLIRLFRVNVNKMLSAVLVVGLPGPVPVRVAGCGATGGPHPLALVKQVRQSNPKSVGAVWNQLKTIG
jgi:hypothetical protein